MYDRTNAADVYLYLKTCKPPRHALVTSQGRFYIDEFELCIRADLPSTRKPFVR